MSQLSALCDSKNVRADVKYGAPVNDTFPNSNPWTVTLIYQGRRMTIPFYTGYGISGEPTTADVLSCLLSDASSVDNARGFEDWANDLGYESDSRKAERIYRQCEKNAVRLHKLLGDDFETFASAEH